MTPLRGRLIPGLLAPLLLGGALLARDGFLPAPEKTTTPGEESQAARTQFLICLRPARPEAAATEEEKAKITAHFEYVKELRAQGKLILAGLATDDYTGIVILEARDRLEAERMMVMDPAVRANVFLAELHPFRVALMAGGK